METAFGGGEEGEDGAHGHDDGDHNHDNDAHIHDNDGDDDALSVGHTK